MPYTQNMTGAQRPALHVYYVLDTSGSMVHEPIDVLNRAMESTVDALKSVAKYNSNAHVKIAVLEFSTTCRWIQPRGPENIEDFFWEDDLKASGMTYMGAALDELNSKLHRGRFLGASASTFLPVIIFMTDGFANDDWQSALKRIQKNQWFQKATRIGFAIGKNPDKAMIAKIVGDAEKVIRTDDLGLFAAMLKFVSTSSVSLGSQSRTDGDEDLGPRVIQEAKEQAGIDDNFVFDVDDMPGGWS